ncbi:MAG TPA: hypothetical protein PKD85_00945, partial [Saprospiraceae bacterium]|nr:hypothetical protein [Saprospiraceae bacterium]
KPKVKKEVTKPKVKKEVTKPKIKKEITKPKIKEDKKEVTKPTIKKEITKPKVKEVTKPKIIVAQSGRGVPYPKIEGYKAYPIHSRGAKPWKEMSPFLIGPIEFKDSDGNVEECPIFENFWQGTKVWKKVTKQKQKKPEWVWPAETHIGKDGDPNDKWYEWHEALLKHEKPVRRPNGKAIPEYAWWFNSKTKDFEKLGLVEARKKIYIDTLQKLYRKNPVYKTLLKEFRAGQNVLLIEPDGPWHEIYPNGREVTLDLLKKLVEKTNYEDEGYKGKYMPFGHGYVAAMCLLEDY